MLVFRGTMLIGAGVSLLGILGSRDDRQVKRLIHTVAVTGAPFPSMVVVYNKEREAQI